jgi:hypothetical protein
MPRLIPSSSPVIAGVVALGLTLVVSQSPSGQEPAAGQAAPGAQAQGAGGRGGGGRAGGGRGGGRGANIPLSDLRKVPAETTAAKVKDPNWKAPRNAWGHPDLEGVWTSDDMRGIPATRPKAQMDREFMTPEEFAQRAGNDEAGRNRAVNQETFLRNEFGTRTFGYTSILVDPPNGQMPAVTPAALARRKAQAGIGTFGTRPLNTFDDFSLYDRCITRGIGAVGPAIYGNAIRIAQTPTELTITYEMIHDTRVIPLDSRPRLGPNLKLWMGDARGHWEGDTLVIESTNFTNRTSLQGLHSDKLKVTERITRIDPVMLDWRVTVEDPETWAAPFTLRYTITQEAGSAYDLYEYSCHEGNTAVGQGLSSERAYDREYEKLVEEAKAKGLPIPARAPRTQEVYGAPNRDLPVRDVNSSK